jgi:phage-related protein
MTIHEWRTSGGKNEIEEYFSKTTQYEQAEYYKVKNSIETDGFEAFLRLNTRQLQGKLWEIKISQNRIMYVIANAESVYFIHACKKQKGKAEKFELDKAINRAKSEKLM